MRHRLLAMGYAAFALALAAFTGSALAGNGNGTTPPGQAKQDAAPAPAAQPAAPPAAQPAPQSAPPGQAKKAAPQSGTNTHAAKHSAPSTPTTNDNSTGVKPSNATNAQHDTHAPASSNKTKQYGNGKTAGQIATQAGYGNATLHGPGNSQPHKVLCGPHEVDVHALKAKGDKCAAKQSAPVQKTTEQQAPSVCGSTTTVTKTEAKEEHGHAYGEDRRGEDKVKTKSKSVVVAGSCGQAAATVTPAAPCAPSTTTENVFVPGYVLHHTGSKTNPVVKIKYNAHSAHVKGKHPEDVVVAPHSETRTVTVAGNCSSSTAAVESSQSTSQASQAAAATQSSSSQAAATKSASASGSAPSPAAAASAGGVLGATATLTKPAKKPAGGVLGATAHLGKVVAGAKLPFTGLPLWIFVAVAAALVLAGVAIRRTAGHRV